MADLVTRLELRTRVRLQADLEQDGGVISNDEINGYLREGVKELYDLMLDNESGKIFVKNHVILVQTGHAYKLADDFYKLTSVSYLYGGNYVLGTPANPTDYASLAADPPDVSDFRYYLRIDPGTGDSYVYVFPAVDPANLAVTYMPVPPTLATDADTLNAINGWDEYVIISTVIKCLARQSMDTAAFQLRLAQVTKRIQSHSGYLETGMPEVVRDLAPTYRRKR